MSDISVLQHILAARHSCRAFRVDPVADADITQIIETAGRVPSWCNAQPWQVSVTSGAATDRLRAALSDAARNGQPPNPDLDWPTKYQGVYAERRRTCGFQLYDAAGIDKSDRAARMEQMLLNYDLFGAPHVAIVSSPAELGPYGALDCGAFLAAFTMAATALGVATIPQAAIAAYAPLVRKELSIPNNRLILFAISFGYAHADHPVNGFRTERAAVADVIDWHR